MKRTVNINLGGQVFQIDEDAYAVLEKYIQALKDKYLNTEGGSEIINDIEMRLAEMFYERLANRSVLSMADVDEVIKIMGHPEDFGTEEDEEVFEEQTKSQKKTSNKHAQGKRLFRNPDDKVGSGVLSGLSAYFGINDPIWLRLVFVVFLFISFGTALLVYIVLSIIIPEAKTASEKLQMRGEEINVDNIERTIRDGLNDLADSFGGKSQRRAGHQKVSNAVDGFVSAFVIIIRAIGAILGFLFIALGVLGFLGLAITMLLPAAFTEFTIFEYLPLGFPDTLHMVLAIVAGILMVFVPLLLFILLGVRLTLRRPNPHIKRLGSALAILFVISIIIASYVGVQQGIYTKHLRSNTKTITLETPNEDVLRLDIIKDDKYNSEYFSHLGSGDIHMEDGKVYMRDRITLNIVKNTKSTYELETVYSARGKDRDKAFETAELIDYDVVQTNSNSLMFPVAFSFPQTAGLHAQRVQMTLKIPVGGAVYLSKDIRELIYDIKNVTDTYDGRMVDHTWIMMPEGLTCMDCEGSKVDLSTPKSTDEYSDVVIPEPFTELSVKGYTELELIQSEDYRIELLGEDDDLSSMVDQTGDKLTIDAGKTISNILNNKGLVKIVVFTPTLDELNISGSSNTNIKSFKGDALDIEVDGACDCSFTLDVDELDLDLSGATEVVVKGEAEKTVIDMKGASELDASELQVEDMTIEMAGACEATVRVKDKLNAELDGLSELIYIGSPEILSEVSGFSSIKPRN